jgi:3,4-dihydroxy 2-butanone 4-phosphate synthase / GTP cyclohydrolase II
MKNITKALNDLKEGKMVLVKDDSARENEADLVMVAEKVSPEAINFMTKFGRGLINLCITQERADLLQLSLMVEHNTSKFGTNFTVSIDAAEGVTTGSSAFDQAHTILTALNPKAKPHDLVKPGHVFPLVAHPSGIIGRGGHTEATVDLSRLAGFAPAGVLCEVMGADGHMARGKEVRQLALQHNLTIITVAEIIQYRLLNEQLIEKVVTTTLPTQYGEFTLHLYKNKDLVRQQEHLALVLGDSESLTKKSILTRIHSSCLTGDVFGSRRCDCQGQLLKSMAAIQKKGQGVLIYLDQEGRGIGLTNKLRAYILQDQGMDTVEANEHLGFAPDERRFWPAAQILKDLGISKVTLMTNNPSKVDELVNLGLNIDPVPLEVKSNGYNNKYLKTKKERLGHLLD